MSQGPVSVEIVRAYRTSEKYKSEDFTGPPADCLIIMWFVFQHKQLVNVCSEALNSEEVNSKCSNPQLSSLGDSML